jgi:hypothetical protein
MTLSIKYRAHLTPSEKRAITRLALQGVQSAAIARKLKIGRDTIVHFRQGAGLPHGWPKLTNGQKDAVTVLSCLGVPHKTIAAKLHLKFHHVRIVAIERKLLRPDGTLYGTKQTPRGNIPGFVDAIKAREDRIRVLREKFGLGIEKANRLAHAVLDTREFRPGLSRPVLSSVYPQKHHRSEMKLTEQHA